MENRLDILSRSMALPHDLEVLPYSDVIVDAHGIEVFQRLTSDELSVGLYKFYPLLGVECRCKFRIRHLLHFAKGAIIMLKTLIRARFIDLPKWVLRIRDKSLLCSDLGFCNTLFISFEHTY